MMNDLSLHLLDLVQNSISAKAQNISIYLFESEKEDLLKIIIKDDGVGIDEDELLLCTDPFYTKRLTRRVGLGIPLFIESCEQALGSVKITSKVGIGTTIEGSYFQNHIDAINLGNLEETLYSLFAFNSDINITYHHFVDNKEFRVSSKEIYNMLDNVSIFEFRIMTWLKSFLKENITYIKEGTNEVA
jgi:hypothetical protein